METSVKDLDTSRYTKVAFSTQNLHLLSPVPKQSQLKSAEQASKAGKAREARGTRKDLRNFRGAEAASPHSKPSFAGTPLSPDLLICGVLMYSPHFSIPRGTWIKVSSPCSPTAAPPLNGVQCNRAQHPPEAPLPLLPFHLAAQDNMLQSLLPSQKVSTPAEMKQTKTSFLVVLVPEVAHHGVRQRAAGDKMRKWKSKSGNQTPLASLDLLLADVPWGWSYL